MVMVEMAKIQELHFSYPDEENKTLDSISLEVAEGDFIVMIGPSGSGKTTLLKHFKKELLPIGKRTGTIHLFDQDISSLPDLQAAKEVGYLFQNPNDQLVMDTVIQELAFTLENIGLDTFTIQKKIAEITNFLGFQHILHQFIHTLSGGQKQLVNLASLLILNPKILLLDEPTAQLDPIATKEFLTVLKRIHDELGTTIIICEHQLDEVISLANKLIFMNNGKIEVYSSTLDVLNWLWKQGKPYVNYIPSIPRLGYEMGLSPIPLQVKEGIKLVNSNLIRTKPLSSNSKEQTEEVLRVSHLSFQYEKNQPYILDDLSTSFSKGTGVSLLGQNGSGKSTLLTLLAGLQKPRRGKVHLHGKSINKRKDFNTLVSYVSQNPENHFSQFTVYEELAQRAKHLCINHIDPFIKEFHLQNVLNHNPYDLSGGEKQLLVLCLAMMADSDVLLLDEPTKGMDPVIKMKIGQLFRKKIAEGKTIVIATHDIEFTATYMDQCCILFDGMIVSRDYVRPFFADNFFYTTPINRMVRKQLPYALNWKDVVK
ncbi:ATP-binding cassette domain-containing protein [Bacillus carboniphilus]|uniref:ATP-binding cassette domain-containing protein n=1 Tax=Bacillus carboniphilus TaxID=86663 RepID=A0ABY9JTK8_9BACI|nr:ABC transporter ATP-binding protein [Bacillus carboniphilus]WLR42715.1 ATP-binding cassette domain-containing protein [Bacillus carboniphilus]